MDKYMYKIRHKETGKFVRTRLGKEGIDYWAENPLTMLNKNPIFGKVLYDTHEGWSTPPKPTNEDFGKIGCEVVKYKVLLIEQN